MIITSFHFHFRVQLCTEQEYRLIFFNVLDPNHHSLHINFHECIYNADLSLLAKTLHHSLPGKMIMGN